jgi:hypothetical protein
MDQDSPVVKPIYRAERNVHSVAWLVSDTQRHLLARLVEEEFSQYKDYVLKRLLDMPVSAVPSMARRLPNLRRLSGTSCARPTKTSQLGASGGPGRFHGLNSMMRTKSGKP